MSPILPRTAPASLLSAVLVAATLAACSGPGPDEVDATGSPTPVVTVSGTAVPATASYLDPDAPVEARVADLLARMTTPEKFGQMTQVEQYSLAEGDAARLGLGSVLHGGGSQGGATEWAASVSRFQHEAVEGTALGIPIIYGVDAVHGFGGMAGATIFPHQIGLGATGDADLVERIGRATALEMAATGIRWNFAPVLAVPSDVRWGRTYEAYSQDPELVATLGAAYFRGLQGDDLTDPTSVLATAKHFIGDGSTVFGSATRVDNGVPYLLDQGVTPVDEALLRGTLLPPYEAALDAGAVAVMGSFSSWGDSKIHGQREMFTDLLRGELGFQGFVISDWAAVEQINPADYNDAVARSINAGIDMVMVPYDGAAFQMALRAGVESGAIPMERIDEAVSRILAVKFQMGLFENPYPDMADALETIRSDEHLALAREAVAKSQVLLTNNGALPVAPGVTSIAVLGNAANDMGVQAGGWTLSWQGSAGAPVDGTTILEAVTERAGAGVTVTGALPASGTVDLCIAAVGERPYAEGPGDSPDLRMPGLDVLHGLDARCGSVVLLVLSGRPVIITDALGQADAVVASWLPGTAGEGVADVLFGDQPFTGTLPMNWPRDLTQVPAAAPGDPYLFPIGYALEG